MQPQTLLSKLVRSLMQNLDVHEVVLVVKLSRHDEQKAFCVAKMELIIQLSGWEEVR